MSLLQNLIRAAQRMPPVSEHSPPSDPPVLVRSSIVHPNDQMPPLGDEFFLPYVGAWDNRTEISRVGGTAGYIHASSLISMECVRQNILAAQNSSVVYNRVSGGHRLMWAQGRATETHIREGIIEASDRQGVYGKWVCRCGDASSVGFIPDADILCDNCHKPLDIYREPVLKNDEYMVIGSPDITKMHRAHIVVGEIKSMTPDQFDSLEEPLADHVTQAALYRELYKLAGFKVHDMVSIIYGRKQFRWGGTSGEKRVYKEYVRDATALHVQSTIQFCLDTAKQIALHNRAKTLPERTVCRSANDKKAKACPVSHLCFSMR